MSHASLGLSLVLADAQQPPVAIDDALLVVLLVAAVLVIVGFHWLMNKYRRAIRLNRLQAVDDLKARFANYEQK